MHVQLNLVNQFVKGKLKMHLVSEALTISVIFSTVHEVGREQGVLTVQEYVLYQVLTKFHTPLTIIYIHMYVRT